MQALVLVVNGFHLGYLGCFGNEWLRTPHLDDLAAAGVVFDQHFADRPDAAGARRAWRTGLYDFHDIEPSSSPPGADLIAALRGAGVHTSVVIDGSRPWDDAFTEGWERRVVVSPHGEGTPLERTLEAAVEALEACADRAQWLVWVELATLLPPWDVPEDYRDRYLREDFGFDEEDEDEGDEEEDEIEEEPDEEMFDEAEEAVELLASPPGDLIAVEDDETFIRLQRTYAAAVTYLDAGLGLLFAALHERGLLDRILILVTSDRGFPLGEHGAIGAGRPWLHDELVHVPLLMRFPGAAQEGRRVAALTQSVDVMPTLLDAFAQPLTACHGHSLLPLARGEVEEIRPYACSGASVGTGIEWALRTLDWAFLLPVAPTPGDPPRFRQLYVKPDDRWEANDLLLHHQEWAERVEETLRGFVAATGQGGALEPPPLPAEDDEATAAVGENEDPDKPGGS